MQTQKTQSNFVKHVPCENPECGSSDANSLYDDGHTYCFACNTHKVGDSEHVHTPIQANNKVVKLIEGTIQAIADRGISRATCEAYGVEQDNNRHIYPYFDANGHKVAQKVRNVATKDFNVNGKWSDAVLFGAQLFPKAGKFITIVEGELDALAAYQMTGSKFPVVSIRNGAQGAVKDCKANYEYLESFETIVVCFDGDEVGKKAASEVAELFGSKCKIFKHTKGYKDACDYLSAGQGAAFVNDWWKAETYVPDGIVAGSSLWNEVNKPEPKAEAFYPWKGLNEKLYGLRPAELVMVTAGSGLGKSQFLREILYHLLKTTSINIGGMFLEESVRKTARSIMSLHADKKLHLPDTHVSEQELKEAFDATLGTDRIYLFDHFGSTSADNIINRIRYLAKACDCRVIFVDHISIIVSGMENTGDERKSIDNLMTRLRTLVQELEITLIAVSHLKRPNGNQGHEDGEAVSLSQLRGSGAIAQLSDAVITLTRNSMSEDPDIRHTTKIAVAKNRYNGDTGPACSLSYNIDTGRMKEISLENLMNKGN
jgi:twinkle protein